ncbi:hypothetical protein TUM4438_39560 [Shewanella sairae]|uniref:HTH Mu-type domain-containing protein n=1 Tax=Shewanella sairae TaxID=190310 RepID=A0ABQ4PQ28_9GAMM|nr:DNA-binding protein [Shewanella sairae]MCL1132078.1 hypothetical protein [Shewanella sairae]GIU51114.1 hypothetical protein TUM4438_39560 [Shewanella sairae]
MTELIKEWFTADELCGVGGLPQHRSSFSTKAKNEHWISRQHSGKRGAAFEYHISSLPESAQLILRNRDIKRGAITTLPMIWTIKDDAMAPTVQKGMQVAITYPPMFDGGGLYLLSINKVPELRRVQWLESQQVYAVLCDNPHYPTDYVKDLFILAKVIAALAPIQ